MEAAAQVAAKTEQSTGGGNFFSIRAGQLSYQKNPVPNNTIACIAVDFIFANVLYEAGVWDADNPPPVLCFGFGVDEEDLAPHEIVVKAGQAEHNVCAGCPQNAWGTATTGKGKQCRNKRRLALLPAGTFDAAGRFQMEEDPAYYQATPIGYLDIPPTATKNWGIYVKQIASTLKRPPYGVITKMTVSPDPKTQVRVTFEPIDRVPAHLIEAILKRRTETQSFIQFPFSLDKREEPAPKQPIAKRRKY